MVRLQSPAGHGRTGALKTSSNGISVSVWISPLCQTQHKANWPWQWVELPPIWTPKPTIRAAWFITDLSICDRSAPLLLITHTFSVNLSYSPRLYLSAEGSNLLTYNVIMWAFLLSLWLNLWLNEISDECHLLAVTVYFIQIVCAHPQTHFPFPCLGLVH